MSKLLFLTVVVTALVCAAPVPTHDPCAALAHWDLSITVGEVTECYKSIAYNPSEAKTALDTLHTLYNDFFIFRDTALTPNLALPFTSPPVDVIAGIERIRRNKYATDFDFHTDLTLLAMSLNDAHVAYQRTFLALFLLVDRELLYCCTFKLTPNAFTIVACSEML